MATEQKEITPTPWAPAANVGAIFFSEPRGLGRECQLDPALIGPKSDDAVVEFAFRWACLVGR
jgi:hypothetical protein